MDASTTTTISSTTAPSPTDCSDKSSITTTDMLKKDLDLQPSREAIQSALVKAVELRAIHAGLKNQHRFSSSSTSSPVSHSRHLLSQVSASAQDYPVFTPSYDEEPLPAFQAISMMSRPLSGNWETVSGTDPANHSGQLVLWSNENEGIYKHQTVAHSQAVGSLGNRSIVAIRSPIAKSSRSSLADVNSISSYRKVIASVQAHTSTKLDTKCKETDAAVPFTDSNLSYRSQPKNRRMSLSWLFPRFKKKQQNKYASEKSHSNSPRHVIPPQPASWTSSELAMVSAERLKKKLMEARESRDEALMKATEMKTSLHNLRQKLEQVESYCQELKRSLDFQVSNQLHSFRIHENSVLEGNANKSMPVSDNFLIEGFLQVVSEARLSVKKFCKTLLIQIEDLKDDTLVDSINMLLKPYNHSLSSKYSKLLLYHLEAIIYEVLFQDFENCTFQKNGTPMLLDPHQQQQAQFASYIALQDLSWNDVLRKGTKYYSPEFSKFCDQKMRCIISLLNWTRSWPEQLLQAFFVVSKCIWLLHLLAFSFCPPLGILRVEEHRNYDPHYMDDILTDGDKTKGPSWVKAMVMPGFYIKDTVLRCKVICKYKPTSYN